MALRFGKHETITCIKDIDVRGPDGQELCLAYKTTQFNIVAPAYLTDDGYVFKVKRDDSYYQLPAAEISRLQAEGSLEQPLPPYSIPTIEYVFGYSLWLLLALGAAVVAFKRWRRSRQSETIAATPIGTDALVLRTKGDRFIADELASTLRDGETISHQAYACDHMTGSVKSGLKAKGYFLALTGDRLLIVETRIGAFKPLLENRGIVTVERRNIGAAELDGRTLTLLVPDRAPWKLTVGTHKKHFSNQEQFVRDVPRLLTQPSAVSPSAAGA